MLSARRWVRHPHQEPPPPPPPPPPPENPPPELDQLLELEDDDVTAILAEYAAMAAATAELKLDVMELTASELLTGLTSDPAGR